MDNDVILVNHHAFYISFVQSHAHKARIAYGGKTGREYVSEHSLAAARITLCGVSRLSLFYRADMFNDTLLKDQSDLLGSSIKLYYRFCLQSVLDF